MTGVRASGAVIDVNEDVVGVVAEDGARAARGTLGAKLSRQFQAQIHTHRPAGFEENRSWSNRPSLW